MQGDRGYPDISLPVKAQAGGDIWHLCRHLRELLAYNHAHCPQAERAGLSQQLLDQNSEARRILGEGFHALVVLDAQQGVAPDGRFDLNVFLRYVAQELNQALSLEMDDVFFHPEEISQILKDEESTTLFCFVGIQHMPYEALQRIRGFTQEIHRCLFCGPHDFGRTSATNEDAPDSDSLLLDDDDSDVSLAEKGPADSDIKLVMTESDSHLGSDEGLELSLGGDDFALDTDSGVSLVMDSFDIVSSLPGAEFLDSPLFDSDERKILAMAHQAALLISKKEFNAAMEWLQSLQEMCELRTDPLAVCLDLQAKVHLARDDWQSALRTLQRQKRLLEGRPAALIECLSKQANVLIKHRRLNDALAVLKDIERLSQDIGQIPQLASALARQIRIYFSRKDYDEALSCLARREKVCRLYALHDQLLQCLDQQALLLKHTGKLEQAELTFREQQRLANELGKHEAAAVAMGNRAANFELQGDYAAAESYYQRGEEALRKLDNPELLARNLANQAFLLSNKLMRRQDALPLVTEALEIAKVHGLSQLAAQIQAILSDVRAGSKDGESR